MKTEVWLLVRLESQLWAILQGSASFSPCNPWVYCTNGQNITEGWVKSKFAYDIALTPTSTATGWSCSVLLSSDFPLSVASFISLRKKLTGTRLSIVFNNAPLPACYQRTNLALLSSWEVCFLLVSVVVRQICEKRVPSSGFIYFFKSKHALLSLAW